MNFHVLDEGEAKANDRVVLLLHGFPDSSDVWRNQIQPLRDDGYRVIAPDLRGFGQSSKPPKQALYKLPLLVFDVLRILAQLQIGKFHLIGHDWGAILGWAIAAHLSQPPSDKALAAMPPAFATFLQTLKVQPQIQSLAALSVGHPDAYKDPPVDQREKSWYIYFFQFAQALHDLQENDYQLLRDWSGNHPEAKQWIAHFESDKPANLLATLNWYRANVDPDDSIVDETPLPTVMVPTLGLWSSDDRHQTEPPMKTSGRFVDAGKWYYERIEGAGHWMQLDQPDYVSKRLIDWLRQCEAK